MKMKMNTNNMSRFAVRYRPNKHEGQDNTSGKEYFYWVKLDGDYFTNAGKPVGFVAYDENSESIKSFRWDNVLSMIALD
mgnify:CR=1 FL=1